MFQTVKRLFERTRDTLIVRNAVLKGWLTKEQYTEITGEMMV